MNDTLTMYRTTMPSPVGELTLVADDTALRTISWDADEHARDQEGRVVDVASDEHPVLAAAAADGVTIVGVLYQDAPADAEAFLARYGDAGYDHLVDGSGALAIDFGVTGPPDGIILLLSYRKVNEDATRALVTAVTYRPAGRRRRSPRRAGRPRASSR